jgi:hypothetical protein
MPGVVGCCRSTGLALSLLVDEGCLNGRPSDWRPRHALITRPRIASCRLATGCRPRPRPSGGPVLASPSGCLRPPLTTCRVPWSPAAGQQGRPIGDGRGNDKEERETMDDAHALWAGRLPRGSSATRRDPV